MVRVEQRQLEAETGDCLVACLSSITEIPYEHFPTPKPGMIDCTVKWMAYEHEVEATLNRYNLTVEEFSAITEEGELWKPRGFAVLTLWPKGKDRNKPGVTGHAVVTLDGAIIWDPHPIIRKMSGPDYADAYWRSYAILRPVDPSKPVGKSAMEKMR